MRKARTEVELKPSQYPAASLTPLPARTDTKSPPWVGGEVVDICSVGTPTGIRTTPRFGFTVANFWSNATGACVG